MNCNVANVILGRLWCWDYFSVRIETPYPEINNSSIHRPFSHEAMETRMFMKVEKYGRAQNGREVKCVLLLFYHRLWCPLLWKKPTSMRTNRWANVGSDQSAFQHFIESTH